MNEIMENDASESHTPAEKLLQILTSEKLFTLENKFKSDLYKEGMTKENFVQVMFELIASEEYTQIYLDFFEIFQINNRLTWRSTLDALTNAFSTKAETQITLKFCAMQKIELTMRDSIVKILTIETRSNYCYTVYSKYGKIGIYDLDFKQLAVYQLIMTREDINRKEDDRRRRNRWITDAIYLSDLKKIAVINTARSLVIYDVVGLKHIPIILLLSLKNVPKCIAYKYERNCSERHIFIGDDSGSVLVLSFINSKEALFRRKHNDKITLIYWEELHNETDYVKIMKIKDIHKDMVREIIYCKEDNTLITCSKDSKSSAVKIFLDNKKPTMIYEMPRGTSTMTFSKNLNLLITGSADGSIRLWNTLVITSAIEVLKEHRSGIKSILLLEDQKMFVSCAKDGVVKLWSIDNPKCYQSIRLEFPSFEEDGKIIEWATNCMFLGPTKIDERRGILGEKECVSERKMSKTLIWISCCNYLASLSLKFQNPEIRKNFEMATLEPPRQQNNVFIPSTWLLNEESLVELKKKIRCDIDHPEKFWDYDYISKRAESKRGEFSTKINQKIAMLDKQKREMQENVARGAPFLALKLYDIEDLSLSNNLPIHGKEEKNCMDKSKNLLIEADNKDQVFSELSSSRSKSSRSSVVEFEY